MHRRAWPAPRGGRAQTLTGAGEKPGGGEAGAPEPRKGGRGRARGLWAVGFVCLCIGFHLRLRSGSFAALGPTSCSTPFPGWAPNPPARRQLCGPIRVSCGFGARGAAGIGCGRRKGWNSIWRLSCFRNPAGTGLKQRRGSVWGFEPLAVEQGHPGHLLAWVSLLHFIGSYKTRPPHYRTQDCILYSFV